MSAPVTCEQRLWRSGAVRTCQRTVGVRRWWDAAGMQHAACASHIAERLHRCPEADPPWPGDLPEAADPVTVAKWWAERDSWTSI